MIADAGAKPAFKGYYVPAAGEAFKFVLCTSVNEEIVHGMPNVKRILKKGDIVSIDTGVKLDGYFGDSAITVPIGEVSEQAKKLLKVTEESLELAIDQVRTDFVRRQDEVGGRLRAADGLDLRRAKQVFPFWPFKWSLGALFMMMLAHERRHVYQARLVRQNPRFP
jgi:hypothetical protein